MELTNEFEVSVPVEQAWRVLTDVERIAPCLPGAQLQEVEGEEYRGIVKVKVGPITAQYKGTALFVEKNDDAHRAVLSATGRDTRGQGNAAAVVTAQLEPAGTGTRVTVTTDLTITGKVAQFGRGVLADVSSKLLGQFVENLETTVLSGDEEFAEPPVGTTELAAEAAEVTVVEEEVASWAPVPGVPVDGIRRVDSPDVEPVDLLDAAGAPVVKRLVPLLGVAVAAVVVVALLRRRRRR